MKNSSKKETQIHRYDENAQRVPYVLIHRETGSCVKALRNTASGFAEKKIMTSHPLKVALWVGAVGGPADGDVAVAGTLLAGLRSP